MIKTYHILVVGYCFLLGWNSHAQRKSYGDIDIEKKSEITHYSFIDDFSYFPNCFLRKGEKRIGPFVEIFRKANSDIYAKILTSPVGEGNLYTSQWMLLDSDLNIKFLFPANVTSLSHQDLLPHGITFTYGIINKETYGYGVVDSTGRVIFDVVHDDFWLCDIDGCVGVQKLDKFESDTTYECHNVFFGKIGRKIAKVHCKLYNPKDFFLPYREIEGYEHEPVTYPISYCTKSKYWYDLYIRWQDLWVQKLFIHGIYFYLKADFDIALEYFSAITENEEEGIYSDLAQKNIDEIRKIDRTILEQ